MLIHMQLAFQQCRWNFELVVSMRGDSVCCLVKIFANYADTAAYNQLFKQSIPFMKPIISIFVQSKIMFVSKTQQHRATGAMQACTRTSTCAHHDKNGGQLVCSVRMSNNAQPFQINFHLEKFTLCKLCNLLWTRVDCIQCHLL